jgi:hypothetical protein
MTALRFLASVFALVAVLALVVDATPALSGTGAFHMTSVIGHWQELAPASLTAARETVAASTLPWVWDPVIVSVLGLPAPILFGLLAVLCGYLGRRREAFRAYIN